MLFSLPNLPKRSYRDDQGNLAIAPRLLHGRTALKLLTQAIEVFTGFAGRPRSDYEPRALEAVMGNYRLGRCVEACLLARYSFIQPQIGDVLPVEQVAALAERGIAAPSDLRLALWDRVNGAHSGFIPPAEREAFLRQFGQELGLPPDPVDRLLSLDSEACAVLTPVREPFTPHELMRLYNRGAVQTLLAHSTHVELTASNLPGTTLKRLYFVAKRQGVLVEIEQTAAGYVLTLYGPEQAAGSADKYGRRLADVTLSLLRSLLSEGTAEEVAATAYLLMHEREYHFHLDEEIMRRLEYAPESSGQKGRVAEGRAAYSVGSAVEGGGEEEPATEPSFDSLLEAKLYREFKSLERQGYTHGWLVQREPDPLLAPGVVLIPDFAFVRGQSRVFMEIAGFWAPGYRERKLAKLRTLSHSDARTALIVAAPQDVVQSYSSLPFPTVPYKTAVRATDMLAVLDAHFGAREERQNAAQGEIEGLRAAARERGLVPEKEVADTLRAYSRTELLDLAPTLDGDGCRYVPGVGLLSEDALGQVRAALSGALGGQAGAIDLHEAADLAAHHLSTSQVDIEALVTIWPEWRIERPSLFEAYLIRG